MTQLYFRGHAASLPLGAGSIGCEAGGRILAVDLRDNDFLSSSFFSFGVDAAAGAVAAALLKSNAVPGVFGVLVAEPNEAKAPDPSPKAVDAPVVGDDMPLVVRGVTELNGLVRPCDEPAPKRFEVENSRE